MENTIGKTSALEHFLEDKCFHEKDKFHKSLEF